MEYKWNELSTCSPFRESYHYSIISSIIKGQTDTESTIELKGTNIKLAIPATALQSFYEEHGLQVSDIQNNRNDIIDKVKSALDVLRCVPEAFSFIDKIVKSVQIIDAEQSDTDTSYSHPNIPFSIFFSVCEETSIISDFRVAESILHEAMHLMLTLIETHVDFIELNSKETFYSPWRDEERPLRGVLHGVFVFRAIKDFYDLLASKYLDDSKEINFIKFRIEEIEKDFESLKKFPVIQGLTDFGRIFSEKILEI